MSDLENRLQERVAKIKEAQANRQKRKYDLARRLGFIPREAAIVMNWTEDAIRQLAQERKGQ